MDEQVTYCVACGRIKARGHARQAGGRTVYCCNDPWCMEGLDDYCDNVVTEDMSRRKCQGESDDQQ